MASSDLEKADSKVGTPARWIIPEKWVGDENIVKDRARLVADADKARCVFLALKYLYLSGKLNMQKRLMNSAMPFLEPSEQLMLRYLFNRSNGGLRQRYGHAAVAEAKASKFCCRDCGFGDVRTLTLDHVEGRGAKQFRMLCANCHQIKSREKEWKASGLSAARLSSVAKKDLSLPK